MSTPGCAAALALRQYRARARGKITQEQLDELKNGAVVEGISYGPMVATLDKVNAWNRDNRYLKAFHTAAETPTATAQYDVVVLSGEGVAQLADPLTVWLQLLPKFAAGMGYVPPQ